VANTDTHQGTEAFKSVAGWGQNAGGIVGPCKMNRVSATVVVMIFITNVSCPL